MMAVPALLLSDAPDVTPEASPDAPPYVPPTALMGLAGVALAEPSYLAPPGYGHGADSQVSDEGNNSSLHLSDIGSIGEEITRLYQSWG